VYGLYEGRSTGSTQYFLNPHLRTQQVASSTRQQSISTGVFFPHERSWFYLDKPEVSFLSFFVLFGLCFDLLSILTYNFQGAVEVLGSPLFGRDVGHLENMTSFYMMRIMMCSPRFDLLVSSFIR
jgi:hypothetical protein